MDMAGTKDHIKRMDIRLGSKGLSFKMYTVEGRRYRLRYVPWSCNRLPMYMDRMSRLTTLVLNTRRSTVLTDELSALKVLQNLTIEGDFVLTDQSLIVPTLKSITLNGLDLHTVDLNRSIRSLGRLKRFSMRSCYLEADYILDFSKCTVLKSLTIKYSTLYNMPILEDCSRLQRILLKSCYMYSTALHYTDLRSVPRIKILNCDLSSNVPNWCSRVQRILIKDRVVLMGYGCNGYYTVYSG